MDLIDGFRVFVATVETGSFAKAGQRLGMSGKLASKYLGELEERLGVRLLQRTTRRLGLTPAGEQLYARLPDWLEDLDEIWGHLTETGPGLGGTLRISAPVTFGEIRLLPRIRTFHDANPNLTIDLRLSDAFVDLAAEGIDVAVRIGRLADSALVARRIGTTAMLLAASPGYLARHGRPERIEDLENHLCIRDTNMRGRGDWPLSVGDETRYVAVTGAFLVNSARIVRDLCLAGEGIAFGPDYVLDGEIRTGRLERVLPEARGPSLDIHAVYLGGQKIPRRLRAFLDFLTQVSL